MNTKQLYTAPEADLLVVRFEENIMSNPLSAVLYSEFGIDNAAGGSLTEDDGYNL